MEGRKRFLDFVQTKRRAAHEGMIPRGQHVSKITHTLRTGYLSICSSAVIKARSSDIACGIIRRSKGSLWIQGNILNVSK